MSIDRTVLFVDDDANVLEGLRRSLHAYGFQIRCADSADDALRMMRSTPVHLVVSDQVMAGMSGIEFLHTVGRLFPDTVRFLLTGHASVEMVVDAINNQGIERVYLKPCNASDLGRGILKVLERQALANRALRIIEERKPPEAHRGKHGAASEAESAATREVVLTDAPFGWDTLIRRLESLPGSSS